MMYNYPFFPFRDMRRYSSSPFYVNSTNNINNNSDYKNSPIGGYNGKNNSRYNYELQLSKEKAEENKTRRDKSPEPFLELFGITLFYDDLLLLGMLFFLYEEKVKDQYLFMALILLLLS